MQPTLKSPAEEALEWLEEAWAYYEPTPPVAEETSEYYEYLEAA